MARWSFVADPSGLAQIYRWTDSGAVRLTADPAGARHPAPLADGSIVYATLGARGWQLRRATRSRPLRSRGLSPRRSTRRLPSPRAKPGTPPGPRCGRISGCRSRSPRAAPARSSARRPRLGRDRARLLLHRRAGGAQFEARRGQLRADRSAPGQSHPRRLGVLRWSFVGTSSSASPCRSATRTPVWADVRAAALAHVHEFAPRPGSMKGDASWPSPIRRWSRSARLHRPGSRGRLGVLRVGAGLRRCVVVSPRERLLRRRPVATPRAARLEPLGQ